jgi:hypothetical protein
VPRKGRIKQAAMRFNFRRDTKLSVDDMCREAARLGVRGVTICIEVVNKTPTARCRPSLPRL